MSNVADALAWLDQARSDARTAAVVARVHEPMVPRDVGCHVALLCAQSLEKCIKGCMLLVGQTPALTHGVEVAVDSMLQEADRRRRKDVRQWTPGNALADEPNYEYPWRSAATADLELPCGHALFEHEDRAQWIEMVRTLSDEVAKIAEAVQRGG